MRFSDLVRNVGGAPTDVLTKRLRDLESHGIVRRRELGPPATGVAYELTELGRGLERPMLELGRWGLHFERVDDVAELAPTSLANAIRVDPAQPPADARAERSACAAAARPTGCGSRTAGSRHRAARRRTPT